MEKDIEKYFVYAVRKAGGMALKLVCPGFTGVPDRLVLFPGGIIFFAEIKDTGKKLRPRQEYVKKQLEKLGFNVYVIDNKNEVHTIIASSLRDQANS